MNFLKKLVTRMLHAWATERGKYDLLVFVQPWFGLLCVVLTSGSSEEVEVSHHAC